MRLEAFFKQLKDRVRGLVPHRVGIKWGLFSGFAAFAAIILVMLWVFQIMFLGSFYKFIKVSDIKNSAQTIERNINSDDLSTLLQDISQNNQICIIVSDEYGDLFYSEDAHKIQFPSFFSVAG